MARTFLESCDASDPVRRGRSGPRRLLEEAAGISGLHSRRHEAELRLRGADTNRHDLMPEAAGLLAISVGLSRQFRDDHDQLEAGMVLYDALYRWARDGQGEGHDWPAGQKA